MVRLFFAIALLVILFLFLYEIYKTGKYTRPGQVILALIGAVILAYLLFTCNSDKA